MELLIGAIVSGLVELIKRWSGSNQWVTLSIVALLSVIASASYAFFVSAGWWVYILPILVNAGAVYAFILRRIPSQ